MGSLRPRGRNMEPGIRLLKRSGARKSTLVESWTSPRKEQSWSCWKRRRIAMRVWRGRCSSLKKLHQKQISWWQKNQNRARATDIDYVSLATLAAAVLLGFFFGRLSGGAAGAGRGKEENSIASSGLEQALYYAEL
mmetsp:Transcript_112/g.202  ORF Transcript_112/g.202 Transcript_112/m.202 type:complete len:136 (-) Transcript_112:836-1243(-)